MRDTSINAPSLAPIGASSIRKVVKSRPQGAEFLINGHLTVADSQPRLTGSAHRPAEFRVYGRLVNSATGYPLAELKVKMLMELPAEEADATGDETAKGLECLLGEAVSDAEGRFTIAFAETPLARQQLCLLRNCPESSYYLKIESLTGKSYYASEPMQGWRTSGLTVRVPLPLTPVSRETWNALSKRLETGRVAQLHSVIKQLVSTPAAQSLVDDWDAELRHSVAFEMEQAFADPDGVLREIGPLPTFQALRQPGAFEAYAESLSEKAGAPRTAKALSTLRAKIGSFDDLLQVDWVIDITALRDALIGESLNKFEDYYKDIEIPGDLKDLPVTSSDPLVKYRGYLLAIYTGPSNYASYDTYKQELELRFHQNFSTTDITEQPANQVLIPIVKAILTAPTGAGYGFGLSQASIPAQGQKSHREYLNELIALTQLTARELGLRYRLDLERPDSAMSNPVAENIATLQSYYRDGFSTNDFFGGVLSGINTTAPFFLHYDEWARSNEVTYAENSYQITAEFTSGTPPEWREEVADKNEWLAALIELEDLIADAQRSFSLGQYASAMDHYRTAVDKAYAALDFYAKQEAWVTQDDQRQASEGAIAIGPIELYEQEKHYYTFDWWFRNQRWQLRLRLIHLIAYALPVCQGDVAFAMGDYPTAAKHYAMTTRFRVGRADLDAGAYPQAGWVHDAQFRPLHLDGSLPYAFDPHATLTNVLAGNLDDDPHWRLFKLTPMLYANKIFSDVARELRDTTLSRFCKLRHGNALLEWADMLYRTDDRTNIARARELYKAVLYLHGSSAPISPNWENNGSPMHYAYRNHAENPARKSQKARARRGFTQIELDLNYYGARRDFVPALRYRPLKDAADRLAASARAAQQDFLAYLGRVEDAIREGLVTTNLLKKATLQGQIADEQVKIAEYGVMLAEQQVAQVKAAIEAKKAEIADHNDGWTALGDFISGFSDAVTGLPKELTGKADGTVNEVSVGLGITAAKSGGTAGGGAATSALGASAGPMAAVAVYVYAGVSSINAMEDADDRRHAELEALKEVALPLAEANLEAREAEVTIANLQKQIAQADAELAVSLIKFQANRTLNVEFWASLVTVVRRTMRRYLELGARFAWLAEQALEYEQDRDIGIIRFDYHPGKLQGVTGADLLQLDLAELEAARLDSIKGTVPVKHTYSMASDFPLQFAQLKKTGRCSFQTTELPFRYAYPGTYGYRVIAVSVAIKGVTGVVPVRGLLRNRGISMISRANGESRVSARFPDAFPLSEFRLREDRAIYNLPDEALMSFEGSGVETFWELTFPALANPYSLDMIADIQFTFDARASYSPSLYEQHLATEPTTVNRFTLFSARKFDPANLAALQETGPNAPNVVEIVFDPAQAGLSQQENNRAVKNLILFFAGETPLTLQATFGPQGLSGVIVPFSNSMALSSGPPWDNSQTPMPATVLNQFIGSPVEQRWALTVDKSAAPAIDFSRISDVVLGVEYSADLM